MYLQPLGEGDALFSIERASNKVTINAAWVYYYWGLYDTIIVFSYNAKSSAGFLTSLKQNKNPALLLALYENTIK